MKFRFNTILSFIFLSLSLPLLGDQSGINAEKGFSIEGSVNMPEGTMVVLGKINDENFDVKDTTYLDAKSAFRIKGEETESSIYYITFGSANPPGVPVIVENGAKIKLKISKDEFFNYEVQGGKYNAEMMKLHEIYTDYDRRMSVLNEEIAGLDPASVSEEQRKKVADQYTAILNARSVAIENFIRESKGSPATYFAVRYLFSKPEPKLIFMAAEKLESDIPTSIYTTSILEFKKQLSKTSVGAIAPNIKLTTPEGDSIDLYSLRGKVVLIDFWASWCGPCRAENPRVKKVYEKYKNKGFEIFGVSLDNNSNLWQAAIRKDGLEWLHVSDLKGWRSSAAQLYDVHSIPKTFLVDEEGYIIQVGLRSEQLEQALNTLFNQ